MSSSIDILSFRPDNSGFYRLAAELPPGNTKHMITVFGQDLGARFYASDKVIICNDVFIDAYPQMLMVDGDGNLNHEKINISFETEEFTPTGIYVTFGILEGDRKYFSLSHKENEITDITRTINGTKNTFSFLFPQGDKKLSDLLISKNLFSGSYPLTIILTINQEKNYIISNQKQVSTENLSDRFSVPIRVINTKDFSILTSNILGDEDTPGLINFEVDLLKTSGFGLPGKPGFPINSLQSFNSGTQTVLEFDGYKSTFSLFLNNNFENDYVPNTEINLFKSGVVYVPGNNEKRFVIEKSTNINSADNTNTMLIIDDNIVSEIKNKDIIVTDFLPTHYRIKSDSGDVSSKKEVKVKSYTSDAIVFEKIYVSGSIIDNSNLYIELIDDTTGISALMGIPIDRSQVLTSTTSDLSDKYTVSSIFYNYFDETREIFWEPILPAFDGSLGISSNNDVVYLKLDSSREISTIEGSLLIGTTLVGVDMNSVTTETPPESYTISGYVLNINGDPIKGAEINFQIVLNENIDMPTLQTYSGSDGKWGQKDFIVGQKYVVKITNNPEEYGSDATFSPSEHIVTITETPISNLNFVLSNDYKKEQTGNSSNNIGDNNNAFVLNSDKTTGYIKIDFDKILGSISPEQNLRIYSDIKVFDNNGNTITVRL